MTTNRFGDSLTTGGSPYYHQRQGADIVLVNGTRHYARTGAEIAEVVGTSDSALDFSALTALPSEQHPTFTTHAETAATAANAELSISSLTAQDAVDALAKGNGVGIFTPDYGGVKTASDNAPLPPDLPATFDYYVATTGSNSNDGSSGSPFANLLPLPSLMTDGGSIDVHIAAGTYTDTGVSFSATLTTPCTIRLFFEDGVVLDGQNNVINGAFSCIDANVDSIVYVVCYGSNNNRLHIQNFTENSGNGLSTNNNGRLYAWNVRINNCDDGISAHSDDSYMQVVNAKVENCVKGCVVHTSANHTGALYNCHILGGLGSVADIFNAMGHTFYDCVYELAPTASSLVMGLASSTNTQTARFVRCKIGEPSTQVEIGGQQTNTFVARFEDSFVHIAGDSWAGLELVRCYGSWRCRARSGTSTLEGLVENCIFDGAISITGRFIEGVAGLANAGMTRITVRDSVFFGYGYCLGSGFSAAEIDNWVNAGCVVENCCFFDNTTNFNAAISSTISGTLTQDPLISSPVGSKNLENWAIPENSPCIGAGTGGGNIGATLAEFLSTFTDAIAGEYAPKLITLTDTEVALQDYGHLQPVLSASGVTTVSPREMRLINVSSPATVGVLDDTYVANQALWATGILSAAGFESDYTTSETALIKHFLGALLGVSV